MAEFDSPMQHIQEWLQTDGRGGFALGTVGGRLTRRWHGWWIARHPPRDRVQALAGLEAALVEKNGRRIALTERWGGKGWLPPDVVPDYEPDMEQWEVEHGPLLESWSVALNAQGPPALRVCLAPAAMAPCAAGLEVRPLFPHPVRMTRHGDRHVEFHGPENQSLHVHATGRIKTAGEVEELGGVELEFERECEKEWTTTVWRGPALSVARKGVGEAELAFSPSPDPAVLEVGRVRRADGWITAGEDADQAFDPDAMDAMELEEEFARVEEYQDRLEMGTEPGMLAGAAGAFVVTAGSGRRTVMAGYPWFTDWGRDTMIALPGLCLATGNEAAAVEILDHFLAHLDQGLIPNLFPESGEAPRYNTIDATLWMVEAAFRLDARLDGGLVDDERWERLCSVIDWHVKGTRNEIRMDADGLLAGGTEGSQLTWMDVKVDGHVPTPRHGKAVEIQGLWHNALALMRDKAAARGEKDRAAEFGRLAELCAASFAARFLDGAHAWAADVVDRDGPGTADWSLRPNMLVPFGLAHNVIPEDHRAAILETAAESLLTPRGLRTLAPDDPAYQGAYRGDVKVRDRAYHQGTVWVWPVVPYVKGVLAMRDSVPDLFARLPVVADGLLDHFWSEGCIGQASEIFDGDAPHTPRGCPAQAWSTAAVIEVVALLEAEGMLDPGGDDEDWGDEEW